MIKLFSAVFCVLLLFSGVGWGEQNQKERVIDPGGDPIKLGTTLVQVPVIVRDPGGRYITDLKENEFALFEDGIQQEISFFGSIEEPFSAALLIDSSGSTQAQLMAIKKAAMTFIMSLRPQDRVLVMVFNDSVQVLCSLTGDKEVMRGAIESIMPGEFTQVYEAVYTAVWERFDQVSGRKAVILFTDGIDTASSEITQDDTLDAVVESEDVIIYPIRFSTRLDVERKLLNRAGRMASGREEIYESKSADYRRELDRTYRKADEYLFELARLSGGNLERADAILDLPQAFNRIADELRHQYVLGYYPLDKRRHTDIRRIDISVSRPNVKVRARPGYREGK